MNLVKLLSSNAQSKDWWQADEPVVVAVSAGVDSMVLLYLLERLRYRAPKIIVAHVNHKLRQASEQEERFIRDYCHKHHLQFMIAHWSKNDHPRSGMENAGRQFRYRFFQKVMNKFNAKVLLTAHHLNDQAETIMMRLIRGDDINQLTGIHQIRPFAGGKLIRPLLSVKKASIRSFAENHDLTWFEDQTNYSLDITRNRIRHRLLPQMGDENPKLLDHFAQYSMQLQSLIDANQFLTIQMVHRMKMNQKNHWRTDIIFDYPKSVQTIVLYQLFKIYYNSLIIPPNMMEEILQLLNDNKKPQGYLYLNNQTILQREYDTFIIKPTDDERLIAKSFQYSVQLNRWMDVNADFEVGVFTDDMLPHVHVGRIKSFYLENVDFPLTIRPWELSDRLLLKNGGHQKIRRILIDQKVSNEKRKLAQVLVTNRKNILALLGYKETVTLKDISKTRYTLVVKFK